MDVNSIFSAREIKAVLQVCRDLDLQRITQASRSKAFWSVRQKFLHMLEHSENGKPLKESVCMVCGCSNQCVTCTKNSLKK